MLSSVLDRVIRQVVHLNRAYSLEDRYTVLHAYKGDVTTEGGKGAP